jgi:8-amino-3,8-dideoxy-alpha-D-manno-octulosonate transaminase
MLITDDESLYRRCFALHDQGHSPLRRGSEMGQRPFLGLNFRMTELSGAVLCAQLGKLDLLLARLRQNKALFKSLIADVPGVTFRDLPDPEGDIATYLTVLFPSEDTARRIAAELGSRVAADSGWHIYSHMEQLLQTRMPQSRGCPFTCECHFDEPIGYQAGMLPQTDAIVARAMNIGIGVSDPNLGSAFGVTVRDGADQVRERASRFREVATRYL